MTGKRPPYAANEPPQESRCLTCPYVDAVWKRLAIEQRNLTIALKLICMIQEQRKEDSNP